MASPKTPYSYAGFGTRWLAAFIDNMLLGIVGIFQGIVLATIFGSSETFGQPTGLGGDLNLFLTLVLYIGYPVYFIGTTGQTIGKKAMHIKVVRFDRKPIGYLNAFIREIVGKFLSSFFVLGYLWMLWDKNKQTWHDKIAHTVVVKV